MSQIIGRPDIAAYVREQVAATIAKGHPEVSDDEALVYHINDLAAEVLADHHGLDSIDARTLDARVAEAVAKTRQG